MQSNTELVQLLLKVLGTTLGVMALIMLACIATPHLAKLIDKQRGKHGKNYPPADSSEDEDENLPAVKGVYDASHEEDYDLNYKIYNEDIYGFGKLGRSLRPQSGENDDIKSESNERTDFDGKER